MTIISTTVGRNPLEEMEQPSQSSKEFKKGPGYNVKNDRMISVHFQGKPFSITVIQAYTTTGNTDEAEVEQFYEDLQDLLELTPPKISFSLQGTGMQKKEVKKHLGQQADLPWNTE